MQKKKLLPLPLIILLLAFSCKNSSQQKKTVIQKSVMAEFAFETNFCRHKGIYDPEKYSEQQVQDTYNLWYGSPTSKLYAKKRIDNEPFDYFIKEEDTLEKEYAETKKNYASLHYIHTPYWDNILKQRLHELKETYEFIKIDARAYKDPQTLSTNAYSQYCSEYITALTTKDTTVLLNAWKKLTKEQAKNNTSAAKRYNEMYNSADRLLYARLELLDYGWYNCANGYRDRINISEEDCIEEFKKLFVTVIDECDDME